MSSELSWGEYEDLATFIEQAQAATVRITRSTAVMISDRFAITAAHSPLDENNEITPGLTVQNLWGEERDIVNVYYDVDADFAIVELESAFENSYAVKLADTFGEVGEDAFIVGNPWTVANAGIGWAVAFGTTYPKDVSQSDPGWVSFDIDVQGGFSGSGIFNEKGELLAVLSVSFDANDVNKSPYYKEDLPFQNEFWDIRNGWWASGPGVEFIKEFLAQYGVENEPRYASELPENQLDPKKEQYLEGEELELAVSLSQVDRLSNVLLSNSGAVLPNDAKFAGGGSGTLIHDDLVLTVSHALDDRQEVSIGLYDQSMDPNAKFWALSRYGDIGLVKVDGDIVAGLPTQEVAIIDTNVGDGAYHIGSPRQFWLSEGGWWTVGAVSLGGGSYNSVSSGGMSGGAIYDLDSNIVGVTSTGNGGPSGAQASLTDRQDPHSTAYNPTISTSETSVGTSNFFYLKQFVSEFSPNSVADGSADWFTSGALKLDDFILESGWYTGHSKENVAYLKRYSSDGSVDIDFGEAGTLFLDTGEGSFTPVSMLSQGSHIYLVGTHNLNQMESLFVARLNASGELDGSFGEAGLLKVDSEFSQHAASAIIDDQGHLFIAGTRDTTSTTEAFIAKISDGSLDTSFGDAGYAMQVHSESTEVAADLGINTDGKLFLLSTTDQSGAWDYGLSAFSSSGELDTSFGNNGQVLADYKKEFETANKLLVLDDGVIISGFSWYGVDENPLLFKYDFNGNLDQEFGDNGQLYINLDNGGNNFLTDIKLTEQDEIALLLSGTRRIQANEGWGDIFNSGYTTKLLNLSLSGELLAETGLTFDPNGDAPNYASVFVQGADTELLRQVESSTGYASELISSKDSGFVNEINISGLNLSGETPSVFNGTGFDDSIDSKNKDPVTLYGMAGDDRIGAWGYDENGKGSTLYGGEGNDRMYGWSGNDTLYGGKGFDHFSGQGGDDTYYLDPDFDGAELAGFDGQDTAYIPGKISDYYIWGSSSTNFLMLKSDPSILIQSYDMERFVFDDDEIQTSSIEKHIDLPSVSDLSITLHPYLDVFMFSETDINLNITAGVANNSIGSGSGDDVILGGLGNDDLNGNDGNDVLQGQAGDDNLNGGGGFDIARYSKDKSDYSIALDELGKLSITDLESGDVDTITEVEVLAFSDTNVFSKMIPSGTLAITGENSVGQTLNITNALESMAGISPVSYQWNRDGLAIAGASDTSYILTSEDLDTVISVTAIYNDDGEALAVSSGGVSVFGESDDNQNAVGDDTESNDIRAFSFNIEIPEGQTEPVISATIELDADFISAEFVYRVDGEAERRFDLVYFEETGVFSNAVKLPSYQISGEYLVSFFSLEDKEGNSYLVQDQMLQSLGFTTRQNFSNPNQDDADPILSDLSITVSQLNDVFVANINGSFSAQGEAPFRDAADAFLTFPNSDDSYKAAISIQENGAFSGTYEFSEYAASGTYEISGLNIETYSGNRASWEFDNGSYVFEIDNPNQDIETPSLDELSFYAVFDEDTQRPTLIVEGSSTDNLSGIDPSLGVFTRVYGPNDTDHIGIDIPRDDVVTQFPFRIEMPMLSEFLPGEYSINTLSIYDAANNRVNLSTPELAEQDFKSMISVYFPTSTDISEVNGSSGDDFIFGTDLTDDTLSGGLGNDILYSGSGGDYVSAGAGNDLIIGGSGLGDDTYIGGEGIDTVKYTSATSGIIVNLKEGKATSLNGNDDASIGIDDLSDIENIIAGYYDDVLVGDSSDNIIEALDGDDTITGGLGSDTIDGGEGFDVVRYTEYRSSYTVIEGDSGSFTVTHNISGDEDILTNIELIEFLNNAPSGSVHITGTPTQGETLTASNDLADVDGLGTVTYQWNRDDSSITDATSSSYILTQDDVGAIITVTASYTDDGGTSESVDSDGTDAVKISIPQVYSWSSHALLDNVKLDEASDSVSIDITEYETGQVISASDALAALKIAVDLNPNSNGFETSPYQYIAADVNEDGRVSAADALAILKMAVNLDDAPDREWLLVNETTDFYDESEQEYIINRTDINWAVINNDIQTKDSEDSLVAVLKGDVNGSWSGPQESEILSDDYFTSLEFNGIGPAEQWWVV